MHTDSQSARRAVNTSSIIGMIALLLAGGCGTRSDSPFATLDARQSRVLSARLADARAQFLRDDLRGAFGGGRPQNILALSGGDADGAFGCGILHGWRHSPVNPRPTFDVVTGVSTGALIATFAFLDTERDDQTLKSVYTQVRDQDIFEASLTPGPPNCIVSSAPLRGLIARHVTLNVFARVAAAHRAGRRLYVATAELESGQLVIWPMSRLAADATASSAPGAREAGLKRFQTILLAAASVPVLFPPVEIDGGLHVDAGLLEAIFLRRAMLGIPAGPATRDFEAPSTASSNPPTVYALVNCKLRTNSGMVANDFISVGRRSLDVYTEALQLFNVREIAHVATSNNPPFRFMYTSIPDDVDDSPTPSLLPTMFDPAVMARLYNIGEALSRSVRSPWRVGPPKLDDDPAPESSAPVGRLLGPAGR